MRLILAGVVGAAVLLGASARAECGLGKAADVSLEASQGQLQASGQAGPVPLRVVFQANGGGVAYFGGLWLEFGDGDKLMVCPPGSGCGDVQVVHSYARPGKYEARLLGEVEGEARQLGSVTVLASD